LKKDPFLNGYCKVFLKTMFRWGCNSLAFFIVYFFCLKSFSQSDKISYYTTKQGLSSNTVYMLTEDSIGRLWMTTENGLCVFDGHEFQSFNSADKLPENNTVFIKMLSHDRLFFTTQTKGAFVKVGNQFERPNAYCIKGMANANYISQDNLIVGYGQTNKTIALFPFSQFFNYGYKNTIITLTASSAMFYNNHEILFGTEKGILKMNVKDTAFSQFKLLINKPNCTNLCDDKNYVYFTQNQTIYKLHKQNLSILDSLVIVVQMGVDMVCSFGLATTISDIDTKKLVF